MKSSAHRQATIAHFYRYRYMTPNELASISPMSTATARRTLNDLHERGFLVKDDKRYSLKHEPLYYTPFYESPSAGTTQEV